ncbi:hypothetical protein [Corynebacterium ulceribovis]|uniref:hypothetical protein n=1 Tax=Corynebacterium ulceribovis TaxID=487732 RepID=UPI00037551FE|nr:hypothetical protein [Corynebacterium ulceribovis]
MTSAQRLIWQAAGKKPVPGAKAKLLQERPAVCCITGDQEAVTADAKKALGDNFTDQSLWNSGSGRVGQAALWCCSGKGKESPRMWTWVCAPGEHLPDSHEKAAHRAPGLCLTNRANTRPVIDTLMKPPMGEWTVCVAVSGQKHALPYARTNIGDRAWTVRMEDQDITSTSSVWHEVFFTTLALRRMGVHADNITAGMPGNFKTHDELSRWRHLAATLAPYQSAPITQLALWCITKPIMEDTNAYPND